MHKHESNILADKTYISMDYIKSISHQYFSSELQCK